MHETDDGEQRVRGIGRLTRRWRLMRAVLVKRWDETIFTRSEDGMAWGGVGCVYLLLPSGHMAGVVTERAGLAPAGVSLIVFEYSVLLSRLVPRPGLC